MTTLVIGSLVFLVGSVLVLMVLAHFADTSHTEDEDAPSERIPVEPPHPDDWDN